MTSRNIAIGILKASLVIVLSIMLCLLIFKLQSIFVYVIVSLILTLITSPFIDFLKKRLKFKHLFAVIFTMSFLVLCLVGLFFLFVPLILSQGENLSLLDTKAIENNANQLMTQVELYLSNHHINIKSLVNTSKITSKINFNFIPTILNSILGALSSFGMGLASVLFITFFFLKDKIMFTNGFKKILPDDHEEQILNSIDKTNKMLSRYFIGLIIQLFIVFILYIIVLLIFGVENAFVIAFLCSLLNIVPYVGPLIGSVLAAILTMISNIGADFQTVIMPTTLYVLIGFWIVQLIDNNVSQPIIFSKSVNSHPLEIFLVTLISGFLFGITGMIVAIPFYTMLKVIAKEFFPENKIVKLITKGI